MHRLLGGPATLVKGSQFERSYTPSHPSVSSQPADIDLASKFDEFVQSITQRVTSQEEEL